jgi:hypothetical protein
MPQRPALAIVGVIVLAAVQRPRACATAIRSSASPTFGTIVSM